MQRTAGSGRKIDQKKPDPADSDLRALTRRADFRRDSRLSLVVIVVAIFHGVSGGRMERTERANSGLGERRERGDGEIFNSLLIKANFLWLSLPG